MSDQPLVDRYTVSYTFDTHKSGEKSAHFVSFGFTLARPVSAEEAEAMAMRSSMVVTRSAIYHALARGDLTVGEANDQLSEAKGNHEAILASKFGAAEPVKGDR